MTYNPVPDQNPAKLPTSMRFDSLNMFIGVIENKKIWATNARTADLACGPRPFYSIRPRLRGMIISASEGRRELNFSLK